MSNVISILPFLSGSEESPSEFDEVTNEVSSVLELSTDELVVELTLRLNNSADTLHKDLSLDAILSELLARSLYLNNLIAVASITKKPE